MIECSPDKGFVGFNCSLWPNFYGQIIKTWSYPCRHRLLHEYWWFDLQLDKLRWQNAVVLKCFVVLHFEDYCS